MKRTYQTPIQYIGEEQTKNPFRQRKISTDGTEYNACDRMPTHRAPTHNRKKIKTTDCGSGNEQDTIPPHNQPTGQ